MSNSPNDVASRIAEIKNIFVANDEFSQLKDEFDRLLLRRRAEVAAGHQTEARGVALIGMTGSGKSRCVERLIATHEDLRLTGRKREVISFIVPSPTTLKSVGETALRALGYPMQANRTAAVLWDMVRHQLKVRGALFLHLDEAQDLYSHKNEAEMRAVVNTLKSLMQTRDWPVGIILSGMPDLETLLAFDKQLQRRVRPIRFRALDQHDNADDIRQVLRSFAVKAMLEVDPVLNGQQFVDALLEVSEHRFGLTIEIVVDAMEEALLQDAIVLEPRHFADVLAKRTGDFVTRNRLHEIGALSHA